MMDEMANSRTRFGWQEVTEGKGGRGVSEVRKGMHSVASFCLFKLVLNCRVSARGKWNTLNRLRFGFQFPLCTVAKNEALSVQLMRLQLACGCCRSETGDGGGELMHELQRQVRQMRQMRQNQLW